MADVKWIKIVTDIFDDEKILLIESLPEHDAIIVIWFKLLCLAGKMNNSGVFMMNDKIAYTEEMLSTIFRRPLNTVRLALSTFENFGMIERIDNVITIPNWGKHQNLEGIENRKKYMQKYMRDYRAKQKQVAQNNYDNTSNGITVDWATLKGIFNNRCAYCGEEEKTAGTLHQDHIIPFSKDGEFILGNIIPACKICNRSKNNKDMEEWYVKQSFFNQESLNFIKEYQNNTVQFLSKHLHKHLHKHNVNSLEEEVEEDNKDIEKKEIVPYQEIADLYNSTCISFPRLTKLSDARKKAIKARLNTYTIEDFKKLFTMAEESNFLKGKNDRNWSATFDWLIKDSNMAKVLDGNYKNSTTQPKKQQSTNKFNQYPQREYTADDYAEIERRLTNKGL